MASIFSKKKILIVGFSYTVDVYQHKLYSIAQLGEVEIGVLAPSNWFMSEWNKRLILKQRYSGYTLFPVDVNFLNGVKGGFLYPFLETYRAICKFKPDIIHVEQEVFSLSTFQMVIFSLLLNIPMTVFCWENIQKSLSILRTWTRSVVLRNAKIIIAGNQDAKKLVQTWGYHGKVFVLPQFGVDTDLFHPINMQNQRNEFVFGYIGRVVFEKGVKVLFDAVAAVIKEGHTVRLLICGSGSDEEALKQYVWELGIGNNVDWVGYVEYNDVPDILGRLDALVLPSQTVPRKWKEQFGHVLIEAMAMGIPIIGSSSGAIPEVIGRDDLIFQEGKYQDLANIMKRILLDGSYYQEISKYGLERVSKEYDDQIIAERLISIWKELD